MPYPRPRRKLALLAASVALLGSTSALLAHHSAFCNPPPQPPSPPLLRGAATVSSVDPLPWNWVHWWEANRARFLNAPHQGGDRQAADPAWVEQLRADAKELLRKSLESPDPAVRRTASIALGRISGDGVVNDLRTLLESETDESVRRMAIVGLGLTGDPQVQQFLASHDYRNAATREAGIVALGLAPTMEPAVAANLRQTLNTAPPGLATLAAWALTRHAQTTDLAAIENALRTDDSPWLVSELLLAMGERRDPGSLRLLRTVLLTETRDVKDSELFALPAWRKLYESQIATQAAIATSRRQNASNERRIQQYHEDHDRFYADDPNAPPPGHAKHVGPSRSLTEGIERIYLERLRASAAIALGRLDFPEAHAALLEFLEEHDHEHNHLPKGMAIMALGEAGYEEAAPVLLSILSNESNGRLKSRENRESPLRGYAALALGLYARPVETPQGAHDRPRFDEVLDALHQRAADERERPEVRAASALALGLTGRTAALPSLLDTSRRTESRDEVFRGYLLLGRAMLADRNVLEDASRFLRSRDETSGVEPILANRAATLALGVLRLDEAVPAIAAAWHPDFYTSREAITAYGISDTYGVAENLIDRLTNTRDPLEAVFYIEALGEILATEPWDQIGSLSAHTNYTWKNERRQPFQSLGNGFLFDYMLPALGDEQWP